MVLFIVLGVVVSIALVVLGILFYMLSKEGQNSMDEKAVPLRDLDQLKRELSTGILEPQKPKFDPQDSEIIPAFVPKVSIPTQPTVNSLEDDSYRMRAKDLEAELHVINQKAQDQQLEAQRMIDTLTEENESLKRQKAALEQAEQKLNELQVEATGLKAQNTDLQTQLETTNGNVKLLEEQMSVVKVQMGEEISRANATVAELTREKEALLSAPQPEPDEGLRKEIEALQAEHLQLRQKYDDLERTQQKLRELNTHLMEKSDLLQYELVKARAQSSGLERVSFNYKIQVEDFFKKISAVQVTNDHLAQVKNRLEGMIEQVKGQNEELVKKDQLAQFELEKNRTRLVSLEREYEELKARVQQGK